MISGLSWRIEAAPLMRRFVTGRKFVARTALKLSRWVDKATRERRDVLAARSMRTNAPVWKPAPLGFGTFA
jgi:hypothetical protein